MKTAWMDAQFVLDFHQTCLTLLVWLLATFACLSVLASVLQLCLECSLSTRSASLASKPHCDIGAQGAKRVIRFALGPPRSQNRLGDHSMLSALRQAGSKVSGVASARSRWTRMMLSAPSPWRLCLDHGA